MRRYEIESFYYQEVDEGLIDLDKDGKRRQQIRQYEQYKKPDAELVDNDTLDEKRSIHKTDKKMRLAKKHFFHELLSKAGLADAKHEILTEKIIDGDSLSDFADYCVTNKEKIARWFEIEIRSDIHKKPAQQLGKFLRLLGIQWKKEKSIKKGGGKVYRYIIPQSEIDDLDAIVARRHDSKVTERWYEDRESLIENRLFEPVPETTPEAEEILRHMTI